MLVVDASLAVELSIDRIGRLVTLDGKLRDGAKRLGFVVTPTEL